MIRIINQDFDKQHYEQLAKELIYLDIRTSLPHEMLTPLYLYVTQLEPYFSGMIHAYYLKQDNTRYDMLTEQMETFLTHFQKLLIDLKSNTQFDKPFLWFWNEIADILQNDCTAIRDQYLTNSVNYLLYELKSVI
jgi:hypothetical protein